VIFEGMLMPYLEFLIKMLIGISNKKLFVGYVQ
jgi:hypothetical protein